MHVECHVLLVPLLLTLLCHALCYRHHIDKNGAAEKYLGWGNIQSTQHKCSSLWGPLHNKSHTHMWFWLPCDSEILRHMRRSLSVYSKSKGVCFTRGGKIAWICDVPEADAHVSGVGQFLFFVILLTPSHTIPAISTLAIIPGLYNLRYSWEPYSFNHNDKKTCLPFVDADFCLAVGLPNGLFPCLADSTLDRSSLPKWWKDLWWSDETFSSVSELFNKCNCNALEKNKRGLAASLKSIADDISKSPLHPAVKTWTNKFFYAAGLNKKVEVALHAAKVHPFDIMKCEKSTNFPPTPTMDYWEVAKECFGPTQVGSNDSRAYPLKAGSSIISLVQTTWHHLWSVAICAHISGEKDSNNWRICMNVSWIQ